jgi:hypothetical protein
MGDSNPRGGGSRTVKDGTLDPGGAATIELMNPPRPRARLLRAVLRDLRSEGLRHTFAKSVSMAACHHQYRRYRLSQWRDRSRAVIDRPIFILGVQGGGGTLLARCMQRHSKVIYASGNHRTWSGPDEIHNCPHLYDVPETLRHRSYHFRTVNETVRHHPRYGYQRAWLYAIDEFLPEYAKKAEDAEPQTAAALRDVLLKIALAYADDPTDCRFLDKSQLFTIQVPYIAELLRGWNPMFVLLTRNPYACCARAVAKEYGPERGGYIADDTDARIRCAVEHWSNSYRLALESAEDVPMLIVSYEDLLNEPAATLRRICEFCDLGFEIDQVPAPGQHFPLCFPSDEKWYPINTAENERYLRGLDQRLVKLLNERSAALIERLGYEILAPDVAVANRS